MHPAPDILHGSYLISEQSPASLHNTPVLSHTRSFNIPIYRPYVKKKFSISAKIFGIFFVQVYETNFGGNRGGIFLPLSRLTPTAPFTSPRGLALRRKQRFAAKVSGRLRPPRCLPLFCFPTIIIYRHARVSMATSVPARAARTVCSVEALTYTRTSVSISASYDQSRFSPLLMMYISVRPLKSCRLFAESSLQSSSVRLTMPRSRSKLLKKLPRRSQL